MRLGYVLNFSDKTFSEFFRKDLGVDIDDAKYKLDPSPSKANRLRCFWEEASAASMALCINKLIEYIETQIIIGRLQEKEFPDKLIERAKQISGRLAGASSADVPSEDAFIAKQFGEVSIDQIALDPGICNILNQRIDEIKRCLSARCPLGAIFLCGSTLEGILLGIASSRPREFNQSTVSPKDAANGTTKRFPDWTLNDFINVARDIRLVGEDVKKFSHALRDFRNYIHPYQQMTSGFNPDDHTARICWQVLQAAISDLSK